MEEQNINQAQPINYQDGSKYFGATNTDGLKEGKGCLRYPNGDSYIGEWKRD